MKPAKDPDYWFDENLDLKMKPWLARKTEQLPSFARELILDLECKYRCLAITHGKLQTMKSTNTLFMGPELPSVIVFGAHPEMSLQITPISHDAVKLNLVKCL